MNLDEILTTILPYLTCSAITFIGSLYILVKNPDKIERWGSILFKVGAYISKKSEKQYMATNIQASIKDGVKKLGADGNVLSYGLEIKWIEEETAEVDLKGNNVIVMMKHFKSQSRNLAKVISLYVPKALLPISRKYINPNLVIGLDYTISRNLLENNPPALTYFIDEEKEKITCDVREILNLIGPINSSGRLSRILISEYQGLSGLHPMESNEDIWKETINLLKIIHAFDTAEPGVESDGGGMLSGEYIKMTMVPVGNIETLYSHGILKHLKFIEGQLENGIRHFYIVSAGRSNLFSKILVKDAAKKLGLSLIFEDEYNAIFRGKKRKMYCALCTK